MTRFKIELGTASRTAFPFTRRTVDAFVPLGVVGVYLLLNVERPVYIGRSDQCLRTRLRSHGHYASATHIVWNVCRTPIEAFLLESTWFHALGLDKLNRIHPARPRYSAVRCPYCRRRLRRWLTIADIVPERRHHEQLTLVA